MEALLLPHIFHGERQVVFIAENRLVLRAVVAECCLLYTSTGMSIKDIRQYAVWAQMGDSTLEQRYNLFLERREAVMAQIKAVSYTHLDVYKRQRLVNDRRSPLHNIPCCSVGVCFLITHCKRARRTCRRCV